MYHEIECLKLVVIPTKNLNKNGKIPASLVVTHLLKQLTMCKALEKVGYFLGVTKLKTITILKKHDLTNHIEFSVSFNCRTLLPMKGEVMIGIVQTVLRYGVFLKSGPMNMVYLSVQKMPNYYFVDEEKEKPLFLSNDLSRVEKGVVIPFVVYATRWSQSTRDISVLASIDGESLGPVTTVGLDGFEF